MSGLKFTAGKDLYSAAFVELPPHSCSLIPIDIAIAVPEGHYAQIAPRSGLALKNSIDVAAGVVDEDYQGLIGVILVNNGDCIAQLILKQCSIPFIIEVSSLPSPTCDTSRFGSTGT